MIFMIMVTRSKLPKLFQELDTVPGMKFLSSEQFVNYMKIHYNMDVIVYKSMDRGTFYIEVTEAMFNWYKLKWAK